jgi:hypothetical protein
VKVFVWDRVDTVTDSYHCGGGVVVFAETEGRARELANKVEGCSIKPEEHPVESRECGGNIESVFIMPDAGCC